MKLPVNAFKRALKEGRPQIGLWSMLSSNIVAEIVATAGFDWVVLDTEHSPNELPMVLQQLLAMQIDANTASPVVRPAWNDPVLIKRFLDIGSPTLILPFVPDAEEARRAVERSEEHTSELQPLMRISYAVFCLKKQQNIDHSY